MHDAILQGEPQIAVTFRYSSRARRMTLRVGRMDGQVTLTLPRGVSVEEGLAFAEDRATWIRRHLSNQIQPVAVSLETHIPVLGTPRRVVAGTSRGVTLSADEIAVSGSPDRVGHRLQAYLKQLARTELAFASDAYAKELGCTFDKITLRDTRSRWGSCSSAGALMYSWRLIMAPAEVLSYVAAHEVAHLREMNHSRAFWDLVAQLYGDPRDAKAWLRAHGHHLHRFRFTN